MKASQVIDAIRRADPAAGLPPADQQTRDALLARITAEPLHAPPRPPRFRRRRLALVAVALCVLGACVALVAERGSPDLAARAYAATDPATGIIHEILETHTVVPSEAGSSVRSVSRTEVWIRPSDGTWRATGEGIENAVGTDGRLRSWNKADGRVYTMPAQELRHRPLPPGFDLLRSDVVASFRQAYARGGLHDTGVTTLAGQQVRCYAEVDAQANERDALEQSWCISLATGVPVATTYRDTTTPGAATEQTVLVKRYETLPPSTKNLAKLRFTH